MSMTSKELLRGWGGRPARSITDPPTVDAPSNLAALQPFEEMAAAWERGEQPRAEEFLARYPNLVEEDAIRLVYEEVCLRQEAGEEVVSSEIFHRFPRWHSRLALLLEFNRALWLACEVDFPSVGDDLGDFRLLAEIGRGAVGRTFVASQHSLAQRLVVLKITPLGQDEHLSLARLQHMHIVPLYFEQIPPERGVRVLGMPYLGGATLARILDALRALPVGVRSGSDFVDTLDQSANPLPTEYPSGGPFRAYLARGSYIQAVCWIGACLADALHYAHERGLVHLDVKPSNVLIAGDGQPMLLDFHLARAPVALDEPLPDHLGGTPGYMSPEQHTAMDAVRQGNSLTAPIDGRSDVYSLGLLLYEALGGNPGDGLAAVPPLETYNPQVSPGLSDIVRKCLAYAPRDRYHDAASLALDLRRHLNDLPLHGVANRSLVERWQKWRRRRPATLSRGLFRFTAVVLLLTAMAFLGVQTRQRNQQADTALAEGRRHLKMRRYPEALLALQRGLELTHQFPTDAQRVRALNETLQRVARAKNAAELHDVVDLLRFRSGVSPKDRDEAGSLYRRGMQIWDSRDLLTSSENIPTDRKRLEQVRTDLLDLATILAGLRASSGSGDRDKGALADAVQILRDAKAQFGSSPALNRDLGRYVDAANPTDTLPPDVPPHTAWEHFDLGRSYLRSGEYTLAVAALVRSIDLQPGEFWPHFYHSVCSYHLGRYEDAVSSLNICIALAPQSAECYFNRALAYEALNRTGEALRDDSRALELNPRFADAALNRGILARRLGRYQDALNDFKLASAMTTSSQALGLIDYNTALVHIDRDDRPSALVHLRQASANGNDDARRLEARLAPR